jgi:hypothetical protein
MPCVADWSALHTKLSFATCRYSQHSLPGKGGAGIDGGCGGRGGCRGGAGGGGGGLGGERPSRETHEKLTETPWFHTLS